MIHVTRLTMTGELMPLKTPESGFSAVLQKMEEAGHRIISFSVQERIVERFGGGDPGKVEYMAYVVSHHD